MTSAGKSSPEMSHDVEEVLLSARRKLVASLDEIDRQLVNLGLRRPPAAPGTDYRIALRPDDRNADPMDPATLLDDIVVMRPAMFRAEQMDPSTWWVACYLDENTDDRICWTVTAHARPKHLAWTGYEYPEAAIYEHDLKQVSP